MAHHALEAEAGRGIEVVHGDITTQRVDAVVNAADPALLGGRGVDGAIHAAAGPALLAECRELRATAWPDGLPPGEAVATGAGELPCRYVIHTVGPNRHRGQTEPAHLAACFRRSLDVAVGLGCSTVAVPAVGAGAFGWDAEQVADIAVGTALAHPRGGIRTVRFVLFSEGMRATFAQALARALEESR